MIFENKKILLIAPSFFGYEIDIFDELVKEGAIVDYFDERPSNNMLAKILLRLNLKRFINKKIDKYYMNNINICSHKKYDYILMINIEAISEHYISIIRKFHKDSKMVLYMWDSLNNKKNCFNSIKHFDKVYTFDKTDIDLDSKISFQPLFYISDYENIADDKEFEYDISFVGTIHSDRFNYLKKIKKIANDLDLEVFYYLYYPSKLLFLFRLIFDKTLQGAKLNDVTSKSLTKKEVVDIVSKSRSVVDIQHPKQSGLTMRTIEVFGAKRKILTTNKNILNYDLYLKDNCYLLNRERPELNKSFFETEYTEVDKNTYSKYSLNSWLKLILLG